MKNPVDIWMEEAETKWLHPLLAHVEACFESTFLPSHDHSHHLRVWKACRYLLMRIARFRDDLDPALVEGVLVSALFHDAGMSQSTKSDHGILGKEMCREYFRVNRSLRPDRWEEILEAIERHDQKTGEIYPGLSADSPPDILGILSLADDLEALGIIGIYRYTEIYLARGIPPAELGVRVLTNATERFRNIAAAFENTPVNMKKIRNRYLELVDFFDGYNQQWIAGHRTDEVSWGHLGVVRSIRELCLEKKVRPEQISGVSGRKTTFIPDFFTRLHDELEKKNSY